MKKRSLILMLICLISITMVGISAFAERSSEGTYTSGEWQTGGTQNLISMTSGQTLTSQGWELTSSSVSVIEDRAIPWDEPGGLDGYYGVVIRADGTSNDIGEEGYSGGAGYLITLSGEDVIRANAGHLKANARARFWCQATSTHHLSLRLEFLDGAKRHISTVKQTYGKYSTTQKDIDLVIESCEVPKGTKYIKYWVSNVGSLPGRPAIGDLRCHLRDETSPTANYGQLKANIIADDENKICIKGDTLKYTVRFDEPVTVVNYGTATLTLNGNMLVANYDASLWNKQEIEYRFKLPEADSNGQVAIGKVTGLKVRDDAQNTYTLSDAGMIDMGIKFTYYTTMSVTKRLTNLTASGGATVEYYSGYTSKLTPNTGYSLPSSINVKAGGNTLVSPADYTYDSATGTLIINGSSVTGDLVITAEAVINNYNITAAAGAGGRATGGGTYTYKTNATLTATPNTGYTFDGWYEGTNKVSSNTKYTFAVTADKTYTAKFKKNEYIIDVLASDGGAVEGGGTYEHGTAVTLTATPDDGYAFAGWYDGSTKVSSNTSYAVTVTGNKTYTAKFKKKSYAITAIAEAGGAVEGGGTYEHGAAVTLTATPDTGYTFAGWYDGSTKVSSNTSYTVTITGNKTYTAKFKKKSFAITAIAEAGGAVEGGGTYEYNTSVTLTAIHDDGYAFAGWYDGDTLVSQSFSLSVVVTEAKTFTAKFEFEIIDTWDFDTDSGYMMLDGEKSGFARFFFDVNFNIDLKNTISKSGIIFSSSSDISNDITADIQVSADNGATTFFGDIVNISEDGTAYYAKAYVVADGKVYWSDVIICTPDFTRQISY